ncbi:MAG TPA: hypothetical protein VL156_16075, partial [Terriglobales bacterium]|nr:hypothetical protein [Terriglobales bacterium]
LSLIHLEFEPSLDETRHALLDSFPRPLARHVDIAIIRVAHETVLATPLHPQPRFPDTPQISRGKFDHLRRTTAGFTTSSLDGRGLCDFSLARPLP